ncbi:hypothetical protein [Novosphingopyxis sp.]|uniref:hypothetical protein n=1 Tax=Novosphingopyxis sp. TaxID=2709690 RepID=UPI003B59F74F
MRQTLQRLSLQSPAVAVENRFVALGREPRGKDDRLQPRELQLAVRLGDRHAAAGKQQPIERRLDRAVQRQAQAAFGFDLDHRRDAVVRIALRNPAAALQAERNVELMRGKLRRCQLDLERLVVRAFAQAAPTRSDRAITSATATSNKVVSANPISRMIVTSLGDRRTIVSAVDEPVRDCLPPAERSIEGPAGLTHS